MNPRRYVPLCIILFWLGGALQQSVAPRLSLLGARPDFLLIALSVLSLFGPRATGAWLGFGAGLVHGALSMANMAQYVISRTVSGFFVGWSNDLHLRSGPQLAGLTTAAATLVAQLILLFLAPTTHIAGYLGATIKSAVYNGVLAVPLYLLVRGFSGPQNR